MKPSRTIIENIILEQDPTSQSLLVKYMNGSKKVTYDHIARACHKERFARRLDKACFGQKQLIPLIIIPMLLFLLVWED